MVCGIFDRNVGIADFLKCASQTCLILWVWKKLKEGMDAVQDNPVQSRALSYRPACSLQAPNKDLRDLGSSRLSSSTHQHPLTRGVADGGRQARFFSFPSLLAPICQRNHKQRTQQFPFPPKEAWERAEDLPAPPLQSYWAVDLPFLTSKAVYNWVVRKSLESSVRGMSFQRVGCEEILERWFLRRSSHYIFVLVPHVLFKKQHSMKDYSWVNSYLQINNGS